MRKTVLLDLGNVIVRVDFRPFLTWLAGKAGNSTPVEPLLRSSLFYDFEFGHLNPAEFARRVGALYGADISLPELEREFCGIFPGLVEGIEEVLAGYPEPLYILSNTNELHLNYIRREFPVMEKFARVFASHEMHQRKPYPGIYQNVAINLGVRPQDLVFFDDVHANVEGALKAGLEAHVFESAAQLAARLKDLSDLDDSA